MRDTASESRPGGETGAAGNRVAATASSIAPKTHTVADLDAWAQSCRGRFMVEVEVGHDGGRRTFYYANVRAAERCVERARARGALARVALVQTVPVGILQGLGGGR